MVSVLRAVISPDLQGNTPNDYTRFLIEIQIEMDLFSLM